MKWGDCSSGWIVDTSQTPGNTIESKCKPTHPGSICVEETRPGFWRARMFAIQQESLEWLTSCLILPASLSPSRAILCLRTERKEASSNMGGMKAGALGRRCEVKPWVISYRLTPKKPWVVKESQPVNPVVWERLPNLPPLAESLCGAWSKAR